jgi:hypothetical protein
VIGSRGLVNDDGSAFDNCCNSASTVHACGVVRVLAWGLLGLNANSDDERKNPEERVDGLMDCSAKGKLSCCRERAKRRKGGHRTA